MVSTRNIKTEGNYTKITLLAGTTTRSSLVFTSGTLKTVAESGAMEYDGTDYYLTDISTVRRKIAYIDKFSTKITIDTANSRVGINNASPQYSLDVTGNVFISNSLTVERNSQPVITGSVYSTSAFDGAIYNIVRKRGSSSTSYSALNSGDSIGGMNFIGSLDTNTLSGVVARIGLETTQAWTTANNGCRFVLELTGNNTNYNSRKTVAYFEEDGSFTLGSVSKTGAGDFYAGNSFLRGDIQILAGKSLYSSTTSNNRLVVDGSGNLEGYSRGSIRFFVDSDGNGSTNFFAVYKVDSSTEMFRLDLSRNMGFNGGSFGSGSGVFFIGNAVTVPTTNPSSGGIIYTESGILKYRGSSGTVTSLAVA